MTDLEKRLRELKDQVTGASSCDLVMRYIDVAARIGAEEALWDAQAAVTDMDEPLTVGGWRTKVSRMLTAMRDGITKK